MQKEKVQLGDIKLIGLSVRTNNKNETNPETSKIGALAGAYWSKQIANEFKERVKPGITYSVYTEYESDEHGEYTYFIGEQVSSHENQDQVQFKSLIIPASTYQKFTVGSGKMPDIVIASWMQIWQMNESELGGKRKYIADFEIYDERASNFEQAVIDIYIGIK